MDEFDEEGGVERRPGASREAIDEAERALQATLPADYKSFLQATNGLTGWLNESPVELWHVEVLGEYNREHPDYGEGLVLIGSDGCGNALALDLSTAEPRALAFPWIGGPEPEVTSVYDDGFAELIGDYGRWFR